jgi:signal transduction histidine kinase
MAREECESEHLESVARALERTFALIDDLLSLAREGEAVADLEPVVLADLVAESWQNVDTREATLESETVATIQADRSRLSQLLENLFRNAVEHGSTSSRSSPTRGNAIEHGGPAVTVTVDDVSGGFAVEDDGPGIPPDARDDVFETGYTTGSSGTGYGLSIVEQIAEAHGWTVAVAEGTDGGARFEITGVDLAE